jgi:AcrR family transcriptional regulator
MTADTGGRPLRADAARNRARILDTAIEVFTTKGVSASTEEIAAQAGVGIGTVFRHFPTKEALLEEVFVASLRNLAARARGLATAEDAGAAFYELFAEMVGRSAAKTMLVDALSRAGVDVMQARSRDGQEVLAALEVLLTRAQRAAAVRPDIRVSELVALLVGISRATEHSGGDPEIQARTLAVVFDGLRPPRHD